MHGHKVLMTQPVSKPKIRKTTPHSTASISTSLDANENKQVFPKLTINPLRRFQLVDSDSDDPSDTEDLYDNANKINAFKKENYNPPQSAMESKQQKRAKPSTSTHQANDLWTYFCPTKTVNVQTPVLDEFCEEYFTSVKDTNIVQANVENIPQKNNSKGRLHRNSIIEFGEQYWDMNNTLPSAQLYFNHEDSRIQRLVRDRLPNFFPLGLAENASNISNAAVLDYRSQFGQRESYTQFPGTKKKGLEGTSNKGKRECSDAKEPPQAFLGWVDPKTSANIQMRNFKNSDAKGASSQPSHDWPNPISSASVPRVAGKRRIQADGHSAGHWYTGQDGRKVYVAKNGEELTGQHAYRQYRKESGTGFKKSKKKATSLKG